jgi:hypothetical protein
MSAGFKRTAALSICVAVATGGCATTGTMRPGASRAISRTMPDRAVLAEYVQKLPPGTALRVDRAGARAVRGTLMKATGESLFLQPRTRLPEPLVEIRLEEVLSVTPETRYGGQIGRAIGAGAAAGAGAALAVFLVMVAALSD